MIAVRTAFPYAPRRTPPIANRITTALRQMYCIRILKGHALRILLGISRGHPLSMRCILRLALTLHAATPRVDSQNSSGSAKEAPATRCHGRFMSPGAILNANPLRRARPGSPAARATAP